MTGVKGQKWTTRKDHPYQNDYSRRKNLVLTGRGKIFVKYDSLEATLRRAGL